MNANITKPGQSNDQYVLKGSLKSRFDCLVMIDLAVVHLASDYSLLGKDPGMTSRDIIRVNKKSIYTCCCALLRSSTRVLVQPPSKRANIDRAEKVLE